MLSTGIVNITKITVEEGRENYPFYFTSTTHKSAGFGGVSAVYICFGEALGFFNGTLTDVHSVGAQRSDKKTGIAKYLPCHLLLRYGLPVCAHP